MIKINLSTNLTAAWYYQMKNEQINNEWYKWIHQPTWLLYDTTNRTGCIMKRRILNYFRISTTTMYLLSHVWCLFIIVRVKCPSSLYWHVWFTTVPSKAVYDHKLTRYSWFKNWFCSIVVSLYKRLTDLWYRDNGRN